MSSASMSDQVSAVNCGSIDAGSKHQHSTWFVLLGPCSIGCLHVVMGTEPKMLTILCPAAIRCALRLLACSHHGIEHYQPTTCVVEVVLGVVNARTGRPPQRFAKDLHLPQRELAIGFPAANAELLPPALPRLVISRARPVVP